MSQEIAQTEVRAQTAQLLDGPLKHIRVAALAAALLPLASIAAAPASAQTVCAASGGICGTVFNDANNDGTQNAGETGIPGVTVTLLTSTDSVVTWTNPDGTFAFIGTLPDGPFTILVPTPQGTQPSPPGGESDGAPDGFGNSTAPVVIVNGETLSTDFGFHTTPVQGPGTGTPGYWKNHPDAWPVNMITVGGVTYLKKDAIMWLGKVGKDKTTTMFSSLVSATLNVLMKNDASCVASTIDAANVWMAKYGPVGSNVAASSYAWSIGEPLHIQMDNYNNGLLCAPHRN